MISKQNIRIGRYAENDVVLVGDIKASNHHARIERTGNGYQIIDLASVNGVIIAGEAIAPNEPVPLQFGIPIVIGHHELTLEENRVASLFSRPGKILSSPLGLPPNLRRLFGRSQPGGFVTSLSGLRWLPAINWPEQQRGLPSYVFMALIFAAGVGIGAGGQAWRASLARPGGPVVPPAVLTALASEGVSVGLAASPTPLSPIVTAQTEQNNMFQLATPPQGNVSPSGTAVLAFSTPVPTRVATSTRVTTAGSQQPTNVAPAAAVALPNADRPPIWDPRLQQLGVTIQPADVAPGQVYWRLVEVHWLDEKESGGRHHIFVNAMDESGNRLAGQPVTIRWASGMYVGATQHKNSDQDYTLDFAMYAHSQAYSAKMGDLPSDELVGVGLGSIEQRNYNIHTSYVLIFQRTAR